MLVVRRELLTNRVPVVPGGGTVAYVNPLEHLYLDDPAHREEGGTPAIVESIRAGLVFQLKAAVGVETIRAREEALLAPRRRRVAATTRRIEILGNLDAERLSIVSFVVRRRRPARRGPAPRTCTTTTSSPLLNDLFGIQSRGGCSCAGPYGHRLLGIDIERSHEFEREIAHGCEGIKPGWVRINFNYFISEAVLDYVVEAVGAGGRARLAAAPRLPVRAGHRAVAAPRRAGRAAAAARPGRATTPTATMTYPHHDEPVPESALRRLPRRGAGDLRRRPRPAEPDGAGRPGVRRLRAPALVRAAGGLPAALNPQP